MGKFPILWGSVLLLGSLATSPALAQDRSADAILADLKAVEMPKIPQDREDRAAVSEFLVKRQRANEKRSILIGELYRSHPESPELPGLLPERWQGAMIPGPKSEELKKEIEQVLTQGKDEKLVAEAAFFSAIMAFRKAGPQAPADQLAPIADAFIKRVPKDPRGAMFLGAVASKTTDTAKREAIEKRILAEYPESPIAMQMSAEKRIKEAVGKPFEFAFTEALKGTEVSSASLKGKVVIIDFWATWCGPCVAEMPNMKKLYAQYKDKGVEFVGVSLDQPREQGGFDLLKNYVEKNKIEWPQYYDGKVSASDFATLWGIQSIPTVFAVGADGKLATTDARGKLEELIPELLAKAEESKKVEAKP
jgi:thiol-disulfide isomerase/thioredoxin